MQATCLHDVQEVNRFEREMSQDYRLNRHLFKACEEDVAVLCEDGCNAYDGACGGQVLRCLSEKRADIKKQARRQEVFYYIKMDVRVTVPSFWQNS